MERLERLPLLVALAAVLTLSMPVPALHALARDAHEEARAFFYWTLISGALIAAVALATMRTRRGSIARSHLLALVGTYVLLPALALQPMREVIRDTSTLNLYLEMTAALTTTGGTLYDPDRLSPTLHLWRALVAWEGGLLVWVGAAAILAPIRLGGFEVTWSPRTGQSARLSSLIQEALPSQRIARYAAQLTPIYAGLTLALWMMLAASGMDPTEAAIRAMSTLSTSGIVGNDEPFGPWGEIAVFAFLFFAVSRLTFATDLHREQVQRLVADRELRLAVAIVLAVPTLLFLRHWIGAFEVRGGENLAEAVKAYWGATFTVLSFLTTTGFESGGWIEARAWSGLETPAVLLVGLAMFGGGVATTAGGVKLLRVYALYAHGRREMALLVHPHSVGSHAPQSGHLPARGVEAAWVFFMLFATSIAVVTLLLGLTELDFRESIVLASAVLTLCGPLATIALEGGTAAVSDPAKVILCAAMLVGRLEALALIALFNPDFWRK
ncbi:potassium transporter TrkG [Jannaschia sp. W003]|uniref:potassium transporter TrkG n=1 Tax=Jannaschia sp. W003 TaxID=2867012 RepID=UPI0021A6C5F1|nr:potassium transporter TrkG [Jannaschia sp. W003]UWQ20486.1 TrkH family potassium uptake protein [Jannaschia sp. W003]